jgi:predicted TIM-barrel fold metal-dependent hydrolase
VLSFRGVIDIHTHPFTEEAVMGQGDSYREAHEFFGSRPEAPHHQSWYLNHRSMPIETSVEQIRTGGYVQLATVLNMNACCTYATSLPNDYIADYVRRAPDLYLGYAGIDPNMPTRACLRELDRCVEDLGVIGLKFHPAYQDFWPNDREKLYPIYERCVEHGISILFHTGSTRMTRCNIRSCKPEYLDEVATDFPDLRIIMSHFGWPWTEEALAVMWRHQHVYCDLSGWLPRHVYDTQPIVFQYMNSVLSDKFVYGSDYPAISPKVWIDQFAEYIEGGFEWGGKKKRFSFEVLERFFRTNAIAAMDLERFRPELVAAERFQISGLADA